MTEVTFPIPDFGSWTFQDWLMPVLICNVIYGLFTHWISRFGVVKYNKECSADDCRGEKIQSVSLFWHFFGRITLQLPLRLISLCIGLLVYGSAKRQSSL